MKLIFRSDPFTDSRGERIELEDIEITEINGGEDELISFTFKNKDRILVGYLEDIQNEIEKTWNRNLPDEIFKRKPSFTTKQRVDSGTLTTNIHSELHPDLDNLELLTLEGEVEFKDKKKGKDGGFYVKNIKLKGDITTTANDWRKPASSVVPAAAAAIEQHNNKTVICNGTCALGKQCPVYLKRKKKKEIDNPFWEWDKIIRGEDIQAPTVPTKPQIYLDLNDDGHKKMKMPDGSTFCITCSKLE